MLTALVVVFRSVVLLCCGHRAVPWYWKTWRSVSHLAVFPAHGHAAATPRQRSAVLDSAVDLENRRLAIQEAVYEGTFGTRKTEAGRRTVPLADGAAQLL